MILSEKIIDLRKKHGLSQEDLANKLGVSRQSVSKWESRTSIPEISKIIQMSEIFGVSTDYLLIDGSRDEYVLESASENIEKGRLVTLEEANEFMDLTKKLSSKFAFSITIFIWAPIILIMLNALSINKIVNLSEVASNSISVVSILFMVSIAIFSLILIEGKLKKFEYLEKEQISLQYGTESVVKRRQESYSEKSTLLNGIGVLIIILASIPLVISGLIDNRLYKSISVCVMLFLIGVAVNIFVRNSRINESFQKLLQEDEFTLKRKIIKQDFAWIYGVYWSLVTAIYLGYSFISSNWGISWIILPIAGLLSGIMNLVIEGLSKKTRE